MTFYETLSFFARKKNTMTANTGCHFNKYWQRKTVEIRKWDTATQSNRFSLARCHRLMEKSVWNRAKLKIENEQKKKTKMKGGKQCGAKSERNANQHCLKIQLKWLLKFASIEYNLTKLLSRKGGSCVHQAFFISCCELRIKIEFMREWKRKMDRKVWV